jgi:hypothetical protein
MAHYAFIDDNSIVTEVIVGRDEDDLAPGITSWEDYYGQLRGQTCKRTSYNTLGGQHLLGGAPFRGNYAGIGFRYDDTLDAFIPPQPFPSWTLNEATLAWESPVPEPVDGHPQRWDEDSLSWLPLAE